MPKVVPLYNIPPKPHVEHRITPPHHLGAPEKTLWRRLTSSYEFDDAALVVLSETLTSLMRARRCREQITHDGLTVADRFGQSAPHPLLIAEKTARAAFLAGMKALRLVAGAIG
jgi:hypothetical protein